MKIQRSLPACIAYSLILLLVMIAIAYPQDAGTRGVGVKVKGESGDSFNLYDDSHALVIGVSDYVGGWKNLPGVKRDVAAVESVLRAQGFNVEILMNPSGRELDKVVKDFIGRHGQAFGNRLIIYFAGHGETLRTSDGRELGYIVPVDAPLTRRDASKFKQIAISLNMIEAYALLIESKHALFVFDSCF